MFLIKALEYFVWKLPIVLMCISIYWIFVSDKFGETTIGPVFADALIILMFILETLNGFNERTFGGGGVRNFEI